MRRGRNAVPNTTMLCIHSQESRRERLSSNNLHDTKTRWEVVITGERQKIYCLMIASDTVQRRTPICFNNMPE